MVNKEIARQFSLLASLMELHGENAFKTKTYANAYLALRKWDQPIAEMTEAEIEAIPGIGSSVSSKIHELNTTGHMDVLEKWKAKTPEGIQQLLSLKGLGPKKVRQIWDELQVESPTELLYACNENRLVKLSGFGLKTQEDLKQKLTYFLETRHQLLYGSCEEELHQFLRDIKKEFPGHRMEWAGEFATNSPVINQLVLLVAPALTADQLSPHSALRLMEEMPDGAWLVEYSERFKIRFQFTAPDRFSLEWSRLTMHPALFEKIIATKSLKGDESPAVILSEGGYAGLPIEWLDREGAAFAQPVNWSEIITNANIKGILHNHSTWSDGIHSLEEMSIAVRDGGYQYFAICDHSRTAFYANGLSVERVLEQMAEIDRINQMLAPFKVFKGIESDILGDGSLDYEPDILSKFDLVVASVHSNLNMTEEKAMVRLIRAIENPYTRILGHPTGRLLLARQGYPIDHRKIIDACAANGVAIELNANPLRLDIDYAWLEYCMEKEVWVSINPDAHSRGQIEYVKYGVLAARKGGLNRNSCLNALPLEEFENWVSQKA